MARTLSTASTAILISVMLGAAMAAPLREGQKSVWGTLEDPDKDCEFKEDKGVLSITVPGTDHDLGVERRKMNAPRTMRPVEGDFTLQVKVAGKFEPRQMTNMERLAYHGAGFFIRKDENNYIRLDRATFWDGMMNRVYANFELRADGQIERFGAATDLVLDNAKETWLKIERNGNEFKAYASQEAGKWHALGAKTMAAPKRIDVGVAAINSSQEPFMPRFSDFLLKTPEPAKGNGN
jgi:regulation of enolase protein 1 (concanavalin A-like superfamily)